MLMLTRKKGERIFINDSISIVISDITAHRVQIGIDAPKDMVIMREELKYREVSRQTIPRMMKRLKEESYVERSY